MVFIDGQNSYKACRAIFGHPYVNPRLLAEYLAGPRTRNRVSCRFYTGRPNPNLPRETEKTRNLDRRLAAIQRSGVTVVHRPLRYHWDWGHKQDLPRPDADVQPQLVELTPWQRPQEKGIDVVLALDVVEFILTDICDVAIIVSLDRDLGEIPGALHKLAKLIDRPYRLEAAVPVGRRRQPKRLSNFNYTHQITPEVFDLIRDDTNYAVPDGQWTPPVLPTTLPTREGS